MGMGRRAATGAEFEAFERGYRKLLVWPRGEIARLKRQARRRERHRWTQGELDEARQRGAG